MTKYKLGQNTNYEKIQMSEMHASLFQSLTTEQLDVYENIMTAVLSQVGG